MTGVKKRRGEEPGDLLAFLRLELGRRGRITFYEYMKHVLYHPGFGYYTSGKGARHGERDYYTSPGVSPYFGLALANLIAEYAKCFNRHERIALVEYGPGSGTLCRDILTTLHEEHPAIFSCCTYFLCEVSGRIPPVDKSLDHDFPGKIVVAEGGIDRNDASLPVIILCNELIDAFPVHRVIATGDGLMELYVSESETGFQEHPGPLSTDDIERYLAAHRIQPLPGRPFEVSLEGESWMRHASERFERGSIIIGDYGYETEELFNRMPDGSLMCYYRNQAHHDPFLHPGEEDITSHVDFSVLKRAGESAGLRTDAFLLQADFLLSCGIMEAYQKIETLPLKEVEKYQRWMEIRRLIDPEDMGSTFKFLVQSKGCEKNPLEGLRLKHFPR